MGDRDLVLTHDMIVEGVHFLPDDDPADIAWKLVAVNLSDLAGKGAQPLGVLLGYMLGRDEEEDRAFTRGLGEALRTFEVPLLGGDTVAAPAGSRAYGLTAIGQVGRGHAPSRSGAQAGDLLYVTGAIGAGGLGLAMAARRIEGPVAWLDAYRRPRPRLREGQVLGPIVHAMMDVSDGLLIDAGRMAAASGLGVEIDLDAVPLAADAPGDRAARLAAVTAGDDYELLFAAPASAITAPADVPFTAIGRFAVGEGIRLSDRAGMVPLPARLGYEH
jgi:thiamine-monophosphate kinase